MLASLSRIASLMELQSERLQAGEQKRGFEHATRPRPGRLVGSLCVAILLKQWALVRGRNEFCTVYGGTADVHDAGRQGLLRPSFSNSRQLICVILAVGSIDAPCRNKLDWSLLGYSGRLCMKGGAAEAEDAIFCVLAKTVCLMCC